MRGTESMVYPVAGAALATTVRQLEKCSGRWGTRTLDLSRVKAAL